MANKKTEVKLDVEVESEVTPVEVTKLKTDSISDIDAVASIGASIGKSIAEGLKDAKEDKKIVITCDSSVAPRFSVVKNPQGDIMVRDNSDGRLSKVQLKSIEEEEASIQSQDVTVV